MCDTRRNDRFKFEFFCCKYFSTVFQCRCISGRCRFSQSKIVPRKSIVSHFFKFNKMIYVQKETSRQFGIFHDGFELIKCPLIPIQLVKSRRLHLSIRITNSSVVQKQFFMIHVVMCAKSILAESVIIVLLKSTCVIR